MDKLVANLIRVSSKGWDTSIMDELNIRRANENDLKGLIKLLFEVQKVHSVARPDLFVVGARKYTDEELEDILKDETKPIFVAEIDNEIIGYAFCIVSTPVSHCLQPIKSLYIDDLCVDEESRGHHVGSSLYQFVLNYAIEIDCYNVTLNVWADNKNAVKFYESIGLKVQKIGMEKIIK